VVTILDRELYTTSEAARLLQVAPSTLQWWLDGRGQYPPVIRERATGSSIVTWGEFVEAKYLREYRRTERVPLWRLRGFIDRLRQDFQVPYPLAHFTPFVGEGRRLVIRAQEDVKLPARLWTFIAVPSGEVMLAGPANEFLTRVEFAKEGSREAERIRPLGRKSPIVIDPERSSGIPTVRGIRTEAIAELVAAGELPEDIAEDFNLPVKLVKAAVAYEWREAG
jgi:uncharacterized protein (DUF433 family)